MTCRATSSSASWIFLAAITGIVANGVAHLAIDYKGDTGLRHYTVTLGSMDSRTWGVAPGASGTTFYDSPRTADVTFCTIDRAATDDDGSNN